MYEPAREACALRVLGRTQLFWHRCRGALAPFKWSPDLSACHIPAQCLCANSNSIDAFLWASLILEPIYTLSSLGILQARQAKIQQEERKKSSNHLARTHRGESNPVSPLNIEAYRDNYIGTCTFCSPRGRELAVHVIEPESTYIEVGRQRVRGSSRKSQYQNGDIHPIFPTLLAHPLADTKSSRKKKTSSDRLARTHQRGIEPLITVVSTFARLSCWASDSAKRKKSEVAEEGTGGESDSYLTVVDIRSQL
ncbi:hypothetical protein DFH06DRAFT_123545 [Mycena polygramma]|nr:hypothetical protein DFH06DRAFT_123545 [Mycena polygramma]